MADDDGLYVIDCFYDRGGATGFRGKTKDGIALGASLEDVLQAYGKSDAQMDSRFIFYKKRGYQFGFRDKKLDSIHVERPNPNVEIEVHGDQIIQRAIAPK